MSNALAVQNEFFTEPDVVQENPSGLLMRVPATFRQPHWRVRFTVQEVNFEISHAVPDAFVDLQNVARMRLCIGEDSVELAAPVNLFDALLSRAPEPESLAQLSAEDAALLLEHVLTPVLEGLETKLNMPVRLESIQRATTLPLAEWPAQMQCKAQSKKFPVAMMFQSAHLARRLIDTIEALEALGPPITVGLPLQIGPVFLSDEEITSLAVGDELLLGVSSFEGLTGIIPFDETQCWAIKLVEGRIELASSLQPIAPFMVPDGPGLPLFYQLGVTGEDGTIQVGQQIGLARIEEKRMVISHGKRKIAGAKLVKVADGVALRITNVEAS